MEKRIPPTLESERLILRPLTPDHAPALYPMFADKRTMRFMPSLPHGAVDDTEDYIKRELANVEAVHWAICLKADGSPIGMLNYLGGTAIPGMGYVINRDHWGKGITAEAGKVALKYGYEEMDLDRVELWIDQFNTQSQRVAEKMGFKLKGQIAQKYPHEDNHHIMYTYGLWREQFYGKEPDFGGTRAFQVQPVLMTEDVQTAVNYYRDKLGFNVDFVFGDPVQHAGVSYRNWTGQGAMLQLTTKREGQELQVSSYLYIFTDAKLDELYEVYQRNDVEIMREPETFPWGMREFSIRDLNGHVLVFGTQA